MIFLEYKWILLAIVFIIFYSLLQLFRKEKRYVDNLTEKAVLITGCDSGFGNKLARQFDSLGLIVFAGCLFPEGPLAGQLKSECSNRLHIVKLDITKDEDVEDALHYVKNSLKDKVLWAVVNNAGVALPGIMEWLTVDMVKNVFEVNTFGAHRVTKVFLPLLRSSKGRIVFVSSVSGYITNPIGGAYAMSKHAVTSLANVYRQELRRMGISVHTICPSFYKTEIIKTDVLNNMFDKIWKNTSEDVQAAYGKHYLPEIKKKLFDITNKTAMPESKIYIVVDAMVDAVIGATPQITYFPGLMSKIGFWGQILMPTRLHDMMNAFLLLPEPRPDNSNKTK